MKTKALVAIVARTTEQDETLVREVLETAFEVIADALSDHETVRLPGLGRLAVRQVGLPRTVRLAPYGETREVAPHAVHFLAAKRLRIEIDLRAAYV
jgi:nucleoid DNA-binding protein